MNIEDNCTLSNKEANNPFESLTLSSIIIRFVLWLALLIALFGFSYFCIKHLAFDKKVFLTDKRQNEAPLSFY